MPAKVWILNLVIVAVLLEADLGRRNIGWFRVLRPLVMAVVVGAAFVASVPTSGNNVPLMLVGVAVGVLLGLAMHLFISVFWDPSRKRRNAGVPGRAVSRAGLGYAAFLVIVFAARLVFIYGTTHWFAHALGTFLVSHQLNADGLTDALLFMAVCMALARSALLGIRGRAVTRRAEADETYPVAARA